MSTLGKVLLFLNILLAIIVLTMFGLNVGQEKRWATAALVHELPISGLPMDADELDAVDPSATRVSKLTKPVLDAYFDFQDDPELGGKAQVKTVLEELERVRSKVQSKISSAANEDEQRKLLTSYLVPQAKTMIEREELNRRINDPKNKEPVANLVSELNQRFKEAATPPGRTTPQQNRAEQRLNIATLLTNLYYNAQWRQRVMRIVGMGPYVEALERQTQYNYAMAREINALIVQDRAAFERDYADLVETILRESEDLYYLDKFLRDLNTTLAERNKQVEKRKTEVDKAKTALDVSTKNTQAEVQQLNAIQYDLFQLQLRVGQAIQKNQELEQDLRKLEAKKPGL